MTKGKVNVLVPVTLYLSFHEGVIWTNLKYLVCLKIPVPQVSSLRLRLKLMQYNYNKWPHTHRRQVFVHKHPRQESNTYRNLIILFVYILDLLGVYTGFAGLCFVLYAYLCFWGRYVFRFSLIQWLVISSNHFQRTHFLCGVSYQDLHFL